MSRLLLAEPQTIIRELLAMALRSREYEVVAASNGQAMLRLLYEQTPDLVLTELALPGLSGLEIMSKMHDHESLKNIPVVILTAVTKKQTIMEAGQLGAKSLLLKSNFSFEELHQRIEKCMSAAASRPPQSPGADPAEAPAPSEKIPGTDASATEDAPAPAQAQDRPLEVRDESEILKSIKPIITRSQIEDQIDQAVELKAMSPTVGQLIKMTGSSRYSIEQIASVVKQDQAIALKVLKLANSAVYTRGEPAESVQSAVMRIGLSQIREVVMNISVIDHFSQSIPKDCPLNIYAFWEHSIATGLITSLLTQLRGGRAGDIEAAFTMGLLHDVGRMILLDQFSEQYVQVLETATRMQLPLERVESRMMLLNHADLMDKVLHKWKFAKSLVNSIALHHLSLSNLRSIAPRTIEPDATLALSNRLAHAFLLGCSGNETIYPTEAFAEMLKIKEAQMRQIEDGVPDQTHDLKYVMLQTAPGTEWPSMQKRWIDRLPKPFHPAFLSASPAIDAYRILCDRLRSAGEPDQPPNIAIIHFRSVRNRDELNEALVKLEKKLDRRLPALMISPKGNITLSDRLMAGRSCEMLASPMHLARFADAVQRLIGEESSPRGTSEEPAVQTA